MNCKRAMCAVASCIATLSGAKSTYSSPLVYACFAYPSQRWVYKIFSERVRGLSHYFLAAAIASGYFWYTFFIILISNAISVFA